MVQLTLHMRRFENSFSASVRHLRFGPPEVRSTSDSGKTSNFSIGVSSRWRSPRAGTVPRSLSGALQNYPGFSLSRPAIASVIAETPYELRFRQNLEPRAQRVEPVDRTSLR